MGIGGYNVEIHRYVQLGGKGCSLAVALKNSCGFKVRNLQVFHPQVSRNWEPKLVADHITGLTV